MKYKFIIIIIIFSLFINSQLITNYANGQVTTNNTLSDSEINDAYKIAKVDPGIRSGLSAYNQDINNTTLCNTYLFSRENNTDIVAVVFKINNVSDRYITGLIDMNKKHSVDVLLTSRTDRIDEYNVSGLPTPPNPEDLRRQFYEDQAIAYAIIAMVVILALIVAIVITRRLKRK